MRGKKETDEILMQRILNLLKQEKWKENTYPTFIDLVGCSNTFDQKRIIYVIGRLKQDEMLEEVDNSYYKLGKEGHRVNQTQGSNNLKIYWAQKNAPTIMAWWKYKLFWLGIISSALILAWPIIKEVKEWYSSKSSTTNTPPAKEQSQQSPTLEHQKLSEDTTSLQRVDTSLTSK